MLKSYLEERRYPVSVRKIMVIGLSGREITKEIYGYAKDLKNSKMYGKRILAGKGEWR